MCNNNVETKLDDLLDKMNQMINELSDVKYKMELQSEDIERINDELMNVRSDTSNILSNVR